MPLIIGVDVGTTNVKVIAYDRKNAVVFKDAASCAMIQLSPEKAEQDPALVLQCVSGLMKKAFEEVGQDKIDAVCFSSAMHSMIVMDKEGNCLTNAWLWGDTRSVAEDIQLRKDGVTDELYKETGVPVHPALPLCKIVWLKKKEPDLFRRAYKFISIKEYIFFKLFGVYIVDHSIAGASGFLNIHSLLWSEKALNVAGIKTGRLSAVVDVTHAETKLKKEYADLFGLKKEIPFIIGSSDGCLANIGTGVFHATEAALTIGTSGAVRTTGSRVVINEKPTLFCYPLTKNIYIRGGAINNGGQVLQWFSGSVMDMPLLSGDDYGAFVKEAFSVEAGADMLIFLPYLWGERAPVWNAQARAVFFGLHAMHTKQHLMRAVMEGINYALYDVFNEITEKEDNIQQVFVSGGFVQSVEWVQMIADIFNKKVVVTDVADASAIGAAIVGLYAIGAVQSLDKVEAATGVGTEFIPDQKNHEIYRGRFAVFRSLYQALKNEFPKLVPGNGNSKFDI
ncbi:MAG: gluconokinase [Chitinophagaceae bacterium]|nr:gluconokinase [Chitinophagaceae bacterium]